VSAVLCRAETPATPLPWQLGDQFAWREHRVLDQAVVAPVPRADGGDADDASLDARADPETLLLAQCAAEIAAEAGAGAAVHAIGANRQRALLRAAVAALPSTSGRRDGAVRSIVYLPRHAAAAIGAGASLTTLRRLAVLHGDDALLEAALNTSPAHAAPSFERLARAAGWELCQLWSDGYARHALHVLECGARAERLRAS